MKQGVIVLYMLVLAVAACGGPVLTPVSTFPAGTPLPPTVTSPSLTPGLASPRPTAPAEEAAGDFQPLISCEDYRDDLVKTLNQVEVVIENNVRFQDYVSGKRGTGCQLTANGTGADFESPWSVADAVKEMLEAQGWQIDIRYQADGPTGTGVGFRKDSGLCLLGANWQPSPDVDCPEDWPLSSCNMAPEQQLYEIFLNCAQSASGAPTTVPTVTPGVAEAEQNDAQILKLTLRPAKDVYGLEEAQGNVTIFASLENIGNEPLLLAHPNVCFPRDFQEGERFYVKEREGKSEISILISLPNDTQISLRNDFRFFEPGNRDHLVIQPGESKEIKFGWFFPASLGQWAYDSGGPLAEPLFLLRGTYHVEVNFKNVFPKAYVYDEGREYHMIDTAWTGEIQANTIVVVQ